MSGTRGPVLSNADADRLARWFLYHMSLEQRGRLMAELLMVYARVFPGVDLDAIMRAVQTSLVATRRQQREEFAAAASEVEAQVEEAQP